MNHNAALKFSRHEIAIVMVIIALTLSYRVIIIWDRAVASDNAGLFDPLPSGSDQLTYYSTILDYQAGT